MAVVDHLETLTSNQIEDYEHRLNQAKSKISMNLPRYLMRDLIGRVSPYALQKVYKQFKLVRKAERKPKKHPLKSCTHAFTNTMGLPCAHTIKASMDANDGAGRLSLNDVHPH